LSSAPWLSGLLQPPTHLANTRALLAHPGKHLADHPRFVLDDIAARYATPRLLA